MRTALCVLVAVAAAAWAGAPDGGPDFKLLDPDAPIEFSAAHCDTALEGGTVVCTGGVVIRQDEMRLRADSVRAHAPGGKAETIYADGHVIVDTPSGTATGNSGTYHVAVRRIALKGKVVLARGRNVVRGETLTVDLVTGLAKLGGEQDSGRIQGLFTPSRSPLPKE